MQYVVVGAGAIGGTVGARLARDGHDVLLLRCRPRSTSRRSNRNGLTIEGPVEQFSVRVPAVLPDDLPESLGAVLLAVKAHHTQTALATIAPRLADDGFVVSLQNGINEPAIAEAVGAERTVGAFVNFGADYVGPGRIFLGGKGAFYVGEVDGRPSERVERLVGDIQDAQATDAILGYLWSKQAYGAMLFATAVSDLPIADALAEPRYRRLFLRLAEEMLAEAPVEAKAFDGFDPADLEARSSASWSSTGARPRRTPASTATSPCAGERRRQRPCSRCPTGRTSGARSRSSGRSRTGGADARGRTSSCSRPTPGSRPRVHGSTP